MGTYAVQLARYFGGEETGVCKIKTAIDRTYFLEQIVEAARYVDNEYKKGNVAITVIPNDKSFS